MRTLEYKITSEHDGKRVLYFLKGNVGLSSRLIRCLKNHENGIMLNGLHTRTVDILHTDDVLQINIPEDSYETSDEGEFTSDPGLAGVEILYEDEDLIVVSKPATLAVHPSHNHQGDTLSNVMSAYLKSKGKISLFRAVGRLDKGTSGIVVCALNSFAANKLQGNIEKTYLALAGGLYEGSGTIDAPIYRPDPIKTYRTVDSRGDRAVTNWTALKNGTLPDGTETSLLKVKIETGRTHQIRVHFSHMGTPLLGDTMYGAPRDDISHQALHCAGAVFRQPYTGEPIEVFAPIPSDMQNILDNIHKNMKT